VQRHEAQLLYGDEQTVGLYPKNMEILRRGLSVGVDKPFGVTDVYCRRAAKICRFVDANGVVTARGYEWATTGGCD
jgi:hypothetical protein